MTGWLTLGTVAVLGEERDTLIPESLQGDPERDL